MIAREAVATLESTSASPIFARIGTRAAKKAERTARTNYNILESLKHLKFHRISPSFMMTSFVSAISIVALGWVTKSQCMLDFDVPPKLAFEPKAT